METRAGATPIAAGRTVARLTRREGCTVAKSPIRTKFHILPIKFVNFSTNSKTPGANEGLRWWAHGDMFTPEISLVFQWVPPRYRLQTCCPLHAVCACFLSSSPVGRPDAPLFARAHARMYTYRPQEVNRDDLRPIKMENKLRAEKTTHLGRR